MSDTLMPASVHYNQFTLQIGACPEPTWMRAVTTFEEHIVPEILPPDPEFEKKEFDRIIKNLLHSQPLRKKDLGTSRANKLKTVLPVRQRSRQPKRGRGDAD